MATETLPLRINALIEQCWTITFLNQHSPLIWFSLAAIVLQWPIILQSIGSLTCILIGFVLMLLNAKRKTEKIKDWTKEVVVITGGSHGIGASLGKRLTSMGAKVIVIDLMKSDYGISYGADLSNLDSIEPLVKEIIQDHKPTMLVNNVGIMISGQFVDQPIKQLQKVMNINFMSHLYMSRFMLPYFLQKNSGHIVIIINKLYTCSVMGVTGANNSVIYSASKFAISGMCESLRQETLDTNVNISSIYPGLIDTGMFLGVEHKYEYLTPPLTTRMVSDKMVDILSVRRSSSEFLPFYTKLSPPLLMLAPELNDAFHNLIGANEDLSKFIGSASEKKLNDETKAIIKGRE